MITDPWFYVAAVPAVLLFGISKGGFGGGLGVVAVPLMALVISPVQAAAILLPILCLMDLVSIGAYRGKWDWAELRLLIPASLIGIAAGTMLFGYMSPAVVKLIIGIVAISFTLYFYYATRRQSSVELPDAPRSAGVAAGAVGGFTSFVAHSGGPPHQHVPAATTARQDPVCSHDRTAIRRDQLRKSSCLTPGLASCRVATS